MSKARDAILSAIKDPQTPPWIRGALKAAMKDEPYAGCIASEAESLARLLDDFAQECEASRRPRQPPAQ